MALIHVSNLTFAYEGSSDPVFENVNLRLDTDWKLGFTGRNGRGKTTFLHLLMGKYEYGGTISTSVSFDYFPFPVADREAMTLEVAEGIVPHAETWRLLRELNLLGVSDDALYRPFSTLSGGEQTKVLLAALFLKEDNVLLIDEPTNHLDMAARQAVSDYLRSKKGFILVSHDRAFLDNCIDHIMVINRTNIEVHKGNFSAWWENKRREDERELAENEQLKKEIRRLSEAARRTGVWADRVERSKIGATDKGYVGHKAAKMMKRSKSDRGAAARAPADDGVCGARPGVLRADCNEDGGAGGRPGRRGTPLRTGRRPAREYGKRRRILLQCLMETHLFTL